MADLTSLSDRSLAIIFAISPTGLGHLRVTDALYHGLPNTAHAVLLGAQDPSVSAMYRFMSINPVTRWLMEMVERPPFDRPFAYFVAPLLRSRNTLLYQQLKTILSEKLSVPKTILLIAPHTVLAHQLGAIKKKVEREMDVKILLVVQVTDDSPQAFWYVYDADLIVVPSQYTKDILFAYAKLARLPIVPVVVASYPISPLLSQDLSDEAFLDRQKQVDPKSLAPIHMTVPVPGAAVGTDFMASYIQKLHNLSDRFIFHVISREGKHTRSFISVVSQLPYVSIRVSTHDRTTVDNYEKVFEGESPIALEITKPSEQAFKALANPKRRGGVIMLFSTPIGGQEYDNLRFLETHGLIPLAPDSEELWQLSEKKSVIPGALLSRAHHWRTLRLPKDVTKAAEFTIWCLSQGLFSAMMQYEKAQHSIEQKSNGVEQFWQHVTELVEKTKVEN